jgi:hypothetical protein
MRPILLYGLAWVLLSPLLGTAVAAVLGGDLEK